MKPATATPETPAKSTVKPNLPTPVSRSTTTPTKKRFTSRPTTPVKRGRKPTKDWSGSEDDDDVNYSELDNESPFDDDKNNSSDSSSLPSISELAHRAKRAGKSTTPATPFRTKTSAGNSLVDLASGNGLNNGNPKKRSYEQVSVKEETDDMGVERLSLSPGSKRLKTVHGNGWTAFTAKDDEAVDDVATNEAGAMMDDIAAEDNVNAGYLDAV
jgi:hypothetical protein